MGKYPEGKVSMSEPIRVTIFALDAYGAEELHGRFLALPEMDLVKHISYSGNGQMVPASTGVISNHLDATMTQR